MKLLDELNARYDESAVLTGFDTRQGAALVDLAYLVMMIDHDVTDKQLDQLRKRVFGLTLTDGQMLEDVLTGGEIVKPVEIEGLLSNDQALQAFVERRSKEFESEEQRREVLRVLATLSYSDGLEEEEEGICHEIGRSFGLDDDTIEDLLVDGAVDVWELGGDQVD